MPSLSIASIDLLLRAAAIGQVVLIAAVHLRFPPGRREWPVLLVAVCLVAQLMLTAAASVPIGHWRNVLLLLTDTSAYAIWFAALSAIDDRFAAARWPRPAKVALALAAAWHIYYFGALGGVGFYHQINHVIAVILLSHVIFVAMQGWRDDLVDVRRRTRLLIAGVISVYGIMLAVTQLVGGELRRSEMFGLANAGLCFLGTLLFGRYVLLQPTTAGAPADGAPAKEPQHCVVPAELRALNEKLDAFIARRAYTQSNLTIAGLATALGCPEHRLRRLINGVLGYRNFSEFLNRHRVADACRQLQEVDRDTPVLTMALDLGYGSIGPFNRAFKAQIGMTPTEFRASVRNRP